MRTISKNGKLFRVREAGRSAFWDRVEQGYWEPTLFDAFDAFVDQDHSYIDLGAWIGPTVLYACQLARHAYAVEPDPVAFAQLQENVDLNPELRDRIDLFNVCIGDSSGTVRMGSRGSAGDSSSSMLLPDCDTSWTVDSLTLQSFTEANHITDCGFIKMDTEGAEAIILPNIIDYLRQHKPTLHVSLHPLLYKKPKEDLERIIEALRIYRSIYDEHGRKVVVRYYALSQANLTKRDYSLVATDREWTVGP